MKMWINYFGIACDLKTMNPRLTWAILVGKLTAFLSRLFRFGSGGTWPGHLALKINPFVISDLEPRLPRGSILITGTNGKTTTAKLVASALEASGFSVLRNLSGANLLNGIASSLILDNNLLGKPRSELGIFEVDEAEFPHVLEKFCPEVVVVLNLFRDQLDRYAELDFVASRWKRALEKLPSSTKIILNADDPLVASLGETVKNPVFYFGLDVDFPSSSETSADSLYCSSCGAPLSYRGFYYSHVGIWRCQKCGRKRPKRHVAGVAFKEFADSSEIIVRFSHSDLRLRTPLVGVFNVYNILAAMLAIWVSGGEVSKLPGIWREFDPAFGRQEEFLVSGRRVKILLSKNPTGFSENLRLITGKRCHSELVSESRRLGSSARILKQVQDDSKAVLLVLNDGIADGRDVSWIWDVDFEILKDFSGPIWVSGKRKEDLGLRLKYEGIMNYESRITDLKSAIASALESIPEGGMLYILPTYTAMLEVRKILRGRRIL